MVAGWLERFSVCVCCMLGGVRLAARGGEGRSGAVPPALLRVGSLPLPSFPRSSRVAAPLAFTCVT